MTKENRNQSWAFKRAKLSKPIKQSLGIPDDQTRSKLRKKRKKK